MKEIFKVSLGVFLFAINPTLFAVGTICGVIWDRKVQEVVEKIKLIVKKLPWQALALIGLAAFFALPVVIGAGSLLGGAYLGSNMSVWAQDKDKNSPSHFAAPAA